MSGHQPTRHETLDGAYRSAIVHKELYIFMSALSDGFLDYMGWPRDQSALKYGAFEKLQKLGDRFYVEDNRTARCLLLLTLGQGTYELTLPVEISTRKHEGAWLVYSPRAEGRPSVSGKDDTALQTFYGELHTFLVRQVNREMCVPRCP